MTKIRRMTASEMIDGLPQGAITLLQAVAELAAEMGARVALVGGVVRDLALGLPLDRDLDLLIQGNVATLARRLAERVGGRVTAHHDAFGTATVLLHAARGTGGISMLDLAGARTEIYTHPGALPTVQPATLEEDLARRDFSVNAIALEIDCVRFSYGSSPAKAARLLDPYSGMDDLRVGMMRVLHLRSFLDDPTRILRGLRLATRLHLRFDDEAQHLIHEALSQHMFGQISPDRVRNEFCLMLEEPRPDAVLRLADQLGITDHLVPSLQFTPALAARMDAALHAAPLSERISSSLLTLGVLTYDLASEQREALISRYRLPGEASRLLWELAALQAIRDDLDRPVIQSSVLDRALQPFGETTLAVVRIAEPGMVAEAIDRYLEHLRPTATLLNGRDLIALGLQPGPQIGSLLTSLRAAQLDLPLKTRQDAEAWVREHRAKESDEVEG